MLTLGLLDIIHLLNRLLDGQRQIFHVDRFRREIESAPIHCRPDIFHVAISGNHDTFLGRITQLINLGKQGQSVHFRHVDITEHDIKIRMLDHQF